MKVLDNFILTNQTPEEFEKNINKNIDQYFKKEALFQRRNFTTTKDFFSEENMYQKDFWKNTSPVISNTINKISKLKKDTQFTFDLKTNEFISNIKETFLEAVRNNQAIVDNIDYLKNINLFDNFDKEKYLKQLNILRKDNPFISTENHLKVLFNKNNEIASQTNINKNQTYNEKRISFYWEPNINLIQRDTMFRTSNVEEIIKNSQFKEIFLQQDVKTKIDGHYYEINENQNINDFKKDIVDFFKIYQDFYNENKTLIDFEEKNNKNNIVKNNANFYNTFDLDTDINRTDYKTFGFDSIRYGYVNAFSQIIETIKSNLIFLKNYFGDSQSDYQKQKNTKNQMLMYEQTLSMYDDQIFNMEFLKEEFEPFVGEVFNHYDSWNRTLKENKEKFFLNYQLLIKKLIKPFVDSYQKIIENNLTLANLDKSYYFVDEKQIKTKTEIYGGGETENQKMIKIWLLQEIYQQYLNDLKTFFNSKEFLDFEKECFNKTKNYNDWRNEMATVTNTTQKLIEIFSYDKFEKVFKKANEIFSKTQQEIELKIEFAKKYHDFKKVKDVFDTYKFNIEKSIHNYTTKKLIQNTTELQEFLKEQNLDINQNKLIPPTFINYNFALQEQELLKNIFLENIYTNLLDNSSFGFGIGVVPKILKELFKQIYFKDDTSKQQTPLDDVNMYLYLINEVALKPYFEVDSKKNEIKNLLNLEINQNGIGNSIFTLLKLDNFDIKEVKKYIDNITKNKNFGVLKVDGLKENDCIDWQNVDLENFYNKQESINNIKQGLYQHLAIKDAVDLTLLTHSKNIEFDIINIEKSKEDKKQIQENITKQIKKNNEILKGINILK